MRRNTTNRLRCLRDAMRLHVATSGYQVKYRLGEDHRDARDCTDQSAPPFPRLRNDWSRFTLTIRAGFRHCESHCRSRFWAKTPLAGKQSSQEKRLHRSDRTAPKLEHGTHRPCWNGPTEGPFQKSSAMLAYYLSGTLWIVYQDWVGREALRMA